MAKKKVYKQIRYLILLIALLFIFIGIHTNELAEIFKNASTLCLSCIGIG